MTVVSPPTKTIPPAARADLRRATQAFRDCLGGAPQVETATLTVRTFLPSDAAPDGRDDPAGAVVIIRSAGVEYGATGAGGTATVQVPAASQNQPQTGAATVNSTPPTWQYFYRFTLVVEENGAETQDEKDSGRRNPLWRMPDGFARYSTRDRGEDDWCTHAVYLWMQSAR